MNARPGGAWTYVSGIPVIEMRDVPLDGHVWPGFLRENAARILRIA